MTEGAPAPGLRVERSGNGAVLTLTIDREERRNALSPEVLAGMLAGLRSVPARGGSERVVVVRSAGERVFCAGADLAAMAPGTSGLDLHEARGLLRDVVLAMRGCPVPVVARVQGACLAGGVGLVLGADLVVAADSAGFGLPELDVGLWPFMVSALLARHTSPKHAMRLMLTAERMDARTAYELGLVSHVVPADRLDAALDELVEGLVGRPPVAVRLGKAAFNAAAQGELGPALDAMVAQLTLLTGTADAAEGIAAFRERRPPLWTGR